MKKKTIKINNGMRTQIDSLSLSLIVRLIIFTRIEHKSNKKKCLITEFFNKKKCN